MVGQPEFCEVIVVDVNGVGGRAGFLVRKGVRDVDGSQRRETWSDARPGTMLERDGFHDGIGQSPEAEQIGADIRVRGAELRLFQLPERPMILAASFQTFAYCSGKPSARMIRPMSCSRPARKH